MKIAQNHFNWLPVVLFFALWQPKSSVVGLLNEMIAKFEEDPPLSSKTTGDNKDPHDLLAFVSNLQINDGAFHDIQLRYWWLVIRKLKAIVILTCY